MKKSLIALAAVAASGAAMAQSSVTLYGVVDTSVGYVKGEDSVSGMMNGGNATSRLGFRGVEDLGNGLKAEFVLEGQVNPDNGTAGDNAANAFDFKRQSTIGLSGEFGQVRLGRALKAAYNAVSRYDVFGTIGLGGTRAWGAQDDYQTRGNNMVSYYSPKFAGFGVGVDYAFGEKKGNSNDRYMGIGATYDNGPLSLGAGYEKQNGDKLAINSDTLTTWQLGGSYDLGVAKLAAFYTTTKYKEVGTSNTGDSFKIKSWNLGASAPVGAAGLVKVAYNNYKDADANAKAQQFSLGYVHNLSKRTALYGTYSYLKNKGDENLVTNFAGSLSGAALHGDTNYVAGTSKRKLQGFQVGVRHSF